MAKQRRKRGTAGDKTICFPLAEDLDYATLVEPEFDKKEVLKGRLRVTLKVLNSKHLSHVFESSAPRPDPNLLRR